MKKVILVLSLILVSVSYSQEVHTMACEAWVDSLYASKNYVDNSFVKADYVFEDDYNLMSIDEHSRAMWSEGKLPGVKANGTLGILEELEVAHIYIEQLEAKIKRLEAKIDVLADKLGTEIGIFFTGPNGELFYSDINSKGEFYTKRITDKKRDK
jgi:hypothetical protein